MEKEEAELLTHTIVIDEFMTLHWKIPKNITPLQLKAITSKVNKLFNLSEVQINEGEEVRKYGGHWTPELEEKLKELYNNKIKPKDIAKMFYDLTRDAHFLDAKSIHSKINYLKKIGTLNGNSSQTKERKGHRKLFSEEEVKTIIDLYKKQKNSTEIQELLNASYKKNYSKAQIKDKMHNLKKTGVM